MKKETKTGRWKYAAIVLIAALLIGLLWNHVKNGPKGCSATRFLRNSDKINKKNEPTISLAGLVLFCCYEVAVALKVKPPLDPFRFTVFAKDSPLELVAVTVR